MSEPAVNLPSRPPLHVVIDGASGHRSSKIKAVSFLDLKAKLQSKIGLDNGKGHDEEKIRLAWRVLTTVRKGLGYSVEQFCEVLGISRATYERNSFKKSLKPVTNNRLHRFVEIFSLGKSYFETDEELVAWMTTPAPEFGGLIPGEIAMNEPGTQTVIDLLISIRSGACA